MATNWHIEVGMMETQDDISPPAGAVVIDVGETTVTTAHYRIDASGVVVRTIWQRQRGVDSLPMFNGWCDRETAEAITMYMSARQLLLPRALVAYFDRGVYGAPYAGRKFRGEVMETV